jgi:carbon-monoxide dehydrogenase small subunit
MVHAEGSRVETVEAIGAPDRLSPLQESFLTEGGAQCGICTPGMLVMAWAHLREGGRADADSVKAALAGNLCRCTGYQQIVSAVVKASKGKRSRAR